MLGNELIISEGYSAVASVHTPYRRKRKWYVRSLCYLFDLYCICILILSN